MRRQIVISVSMIVIGISMLAQSLNNCIDIEYNSPRHRDLIYRTEFSNFIRGKHGDMVLWDFSNAQLNDKMIMLRYSIRNGVINANDNGEQDKLLLVGDTLFSIAQASGMTNLQYYKPEIKIKYPMGYGDTIGGYFYCDGILDYNRYMCQAGYTETQVVGNGGLITPDCDSLSNVLLLRQVKNGYVKLSETFNNSYARSQNKLLISDDSIRWHMKNDSTTFTTEVYRWYASGYRYPIVESQKTIYYHYDVAIDSVCVSYYTPPVLQEFEIEDDDINEFVREVNNTIPFDITAYSSTQNNNTQMLTKHSRKNSETDNSDGLWGDKTVDVSCLISPTIVTDETIVKYNSNTRADISVMLFAASGVKMWHYEVAADNSSGTITCPMSDLANGNYLIVVQIDDSIFSAKIIKKF